MQIIFDKVYVFQRKKDSKIYLMKNVLEDCEFLNSKFLKIKHQNYICTNKNWKKISVEDFNNLDLSYVGEL